jgi:hypothetical protein
MGVDMRSQGLKRAEERVQLSTVSTLENEKKGLSLSLSLCLGLSLSLSLSYSLFPRFRGCWNLETGFVTQRENCVLLAVVLFSTARPFSLAAFSAGCVCMLACPSIHQVLPVCPHACNRVPNCYGRDAQCGVFPGVSFSSSAGFACHKTHAYHRLCLGSLELHFLIICAQISYSCSSCPPISLRGKENKRTDIHVGFL